MASLNRCTFIGNLGADPEIRDAGGKPVCNFRIACSESWKNKQGEKQERTEWVSIQAWGQLADLCGKYLAKGRQVYVEGRLQTRIYEKDGQKRYATEIVADKVVFLGGGDGAQRSTGHNDGPRDTGSAASPADDSFDVPF